MLKYIFFLQRKYNIIFDAVCQTKKYKILLFCLIFLYNCYRICSGDIHY
jgi:hypothetical protein